MNLQAEDATARSLMLTWEQSEKDGNKPITHYKVTYWMGSRIGVLDRSNVSTRTVNATTEGGPRHRYEIKIENLKPAMLYRFEVVAVNAAGASESGNVDKLMLEARKSLSSPPSTFLCTSFLFS